MNTRTKSLYEQARHGLAVGDAGNWIAAEAMSALADEGETQTSIAAELGCSQTTVSIYVRAWVYYRGNKERPSFTEASATFRSQQQPHIPKTPEKRALLAAELLKDKQVYEQPEVRKAVDRHVDRELRQAAAAANRDSGAPTRTEQTRDRRRLSVMVNRTFWRDLLWAIDKASGLLNEAAGELERTGLPEGQSGEIIRAARNLSKAAERFGEAAGEHAIGSPMGRGA